MQPKVIDNDRGDITVEVFGREVRGWSYKSDAERRAKMVAAHEYAEGWFQALVQMKDRLDLRLNNCLCEMKPAYDDSIVGFNEAWDIVRHTFAEVAPDAPPGSHGGRADARINAGEAAGPSTLAADRLATASASRRGEPAPADDVEALLRRLSEIRPHVRAAYDTYVGQVCDNAAALIRRQQAEIARLRERLARVEGPEDWPAEVARLRSRLERCEAALHECANRLERCIIRAGSDPEYAAEAVARYRAPAREGEQEKWTNQN